MWTLTTRRPDGSPDLEQLQGRRFTQFMNETFGPGFFGDHGTLASAWVPAVDVFEDQEAIKITAELPGVKPEDVKISLEHSTLTLRGEKKQRAEEKMERVHRYERTYGMFERTFTLPTTVDHERIEANYGDGILTVTLPKVERARPKEIPVKVGR